MPLDMTCPSCDARYYTAASNAPAQACEACGGDVVMLPGAPEERLVALAGGAADERREPGGFIDVV